MKFYRYNDTLCANVGVRIYLYEFNMIQETPKGYWIGYYNKKEKWVSKTAKKRYAYPTKEEALASFKARKERQIEILEHQLNRAKTALSKAEIL